MNATTRRRGRAFPRSCVRAVGAREEALPGQNPESVLHREESKPVRAWHAQGTTHVGRGKRRLALLHAQATKLAAGKGDPTGHAATPTGGGSSRSRVLVKPVRATVARSFRKSEKGRHSSLIPTVNSRPWPAPRAAVGLFWLLDPLRRPRQPAATSDPEPAAQSAPPTSAAICSATSPRTAAAGWPSPHDCSSAPSGPPGCTRTPPPS
jgi:hypothetical protein